MTQTLYAHISKRKNFLKIKLKNVKRRTFRDGPEWLVVLKGIHEDCVHERDREIESLPLDS
jgi:hypothetical protein